MGHVHQWDVQIILGRIDPPFRSVLNLRDKCRGGLNGREPCSSSRGYTTATAWRGRRRSVGPLEAVLGTNDNRSSVTRWAPCAADHHCLPPERAYDPAADPSTAAGNAI